MLFNSLTFAVFFAFVFAVYWRLGHRAQNAFLLGASLVFYGAWNWNFLWLILLSSTIDYFAALAMARYPGTRARRACLLASLITNLGVLSVFKYANFFLENLFALGNRLGLDLDSPALRIVLPVGISFYTFQGLSYTIDVYRGHQRAVGRFDDFLLYISFFPQLVAGPIERSTRLMPQVLAPRPRLSTGHALEGIKLMVVGYFQKVALADSLAPFVDRTFSAPGGADSLTLLLGVYAFAVQIYCDFAGYSNIARGTARLLGFRLMVNFREPYLAPNITDFWRRWHISLSTWLRDYLYIPLGGNRKGRARTYVNLLLTMLIGGLWHGASWNFVVWGGLHGLFLAAHKVVSERRGASARRALPRAAAIVSTFHLVCLAWIFFRAQDFGAASAYLAGLARLTAEWTPELGEVLFYALLCFGLDLVLARRARRERLIVLVSRHWAVEACAVAALILFTFFLGENHVFPFVYFQF